MAMNGADLGAAIQAKMEGLSSPSSSDIYTALGEAIIDYIEANAEVTVELVALGTETVTGTLD